MKQMISIDKKGFTLLEVLIYIGLFSFFVSGLIFSLVMLSQSASSIKNHVIENEEVGFAFLKIGLELEQYPSMILPTSDATSSILKIKNATHEAMVSLQTGNLILTTYNATTTLNDNSAAILSVLFSSASASTSPTSLNELKVELQTSRDTYEKMYVVSY